jgi:hypothetical protein
LSFVAGFRGRHQALPDPTPQDMPDDHHPDPDDAADLELPDQQELIDAFMAVLCKESKHACSCLVEFPFRDNDKVRERVTTERKNLLQRDGQPRDCCKEKVLISLSYDLIIAYNAIHLIHRSQNYYLYMTNLYMVYANFISVICQNYKWNMPKL